MRAFLLLSMVVFVASSSRAAEDTYPGGELLMEPARLARPESAREFIVLDARSQKSFQEDRIPGARWVDTADWAKAFDEGKDAEAWSRRIGELGIQPKSRVVVYDNASAKDAARTWWILRYWGVADVRLLNGGWHGWKSADLPLETQKAEPPAAVPFTAAPRSKSLVTKGQLLEALKDQRPQIVDARSEKEFCGTDALTNKRAGAIPGAKHLEWLDLIDQQSQRLKTPEQLRKLFQEAGIDLEKPAVTHCQSGGRSSVMAFGLELMGAKRVGNYYAGWSEWGNAEDTPITPGEPKPPTTPTAPGEK